MSKSTNSPRLIQLPADDFDALLARVRRLERQVATLNRTTSLLADAEIERASVGLTEEQHADVADAARTACIEAVAQLRAEVGP